jgi:hypothetical protein
MRERERENFTASACIIFHSLLLLQMPTTCREIGVRFHDFRSPRISTPCSFCKSPPPARRLKELQFMIFKARVREREFYCKCLHGFQLPAAFAKAHHLPGD